MCQIFTKMCIWCGESYVYLSHGLDTSWPVTSIHHKNPWVIDRSCHLVSGKQIKSNGRQKYQVHLQHSVLNTGVVTSLLPEACHVRSKDKWKTRDTQTSRHEMYVYFYDHLRYDYDEGEKKKKVVNTHYIHTHTEKPMVSHPISIWTAGKHRYRKHTHLLWPGTSNSRKCSAVWHIARGRRGVWPPWG